MCSNLFAEELLSRSVSVTLTARKESNKC